jgi:hypothetical protein
MYVRYQAHAQLTTKRNATHGGIIRGWHFRGDGLRNKVISQYHYILFLPKT